MFDIPIAITVSILLGVFIGIAQFRQSPVMLVGGLAAFGIYYFLFLHNILLGILKQVTR